MTGLYIHVPFCRRRCVYCDFYSTTQGSDVRRAYVRALCEEMKTRRDEVSGHRLHTLYIGGGTPSQLSAEELDAIFETAHECYVLDDAAEVTIEANPDDVTPEWVESIRRVGINRVSLGVQTFDDALLRRLSRRHTADQARQAVRLLAASGFSNLSIDLIYGLPDQSRRAFRDDLTEALDLPVCHLSAYALIYEQGTPLFDLRRRGEVSEADEDLSLGMYADLLDATERAGFRRYEISNFARPGWEARHNSSYWNDAPYVGCGPAAHSYDGHRRRRNLPDLKRYVDSPGRPPFETEELTLHERYDEFVLTRLRTAEGLAVEEVETKFGPDFARHFRAEAAAHLRAGRLEEAAGHISISRSGLFLSDLIMSDLMWPD